MKNGSSLTSTQNVTDILLQTGKIFFDKSPYGQTAKFNFVAVVLQLSIASTGVLLNLAVMVTVLCSRHVQAGNTSKFIISLSVSDLLVCGFVMTVQTLNNFSLLKEEKNDSQSFHAMCIAIDTINIVAVSSSSFTMVGIAADRYLCVMNPIMYYSTVTQTKVAIVIVSLWSFSFLLGILPYSMGELEAKNNVMMCLVRLGDAYQVVMVVVIIFIPCIIVTVIYVNLFHSAFVHINTRISKIPLEPTGQASNVTSATNDDGEQSDKCPEDLNDKKENLFALDFTAHVNFLEATELDTENAFHSRIRHSLKSNFMQHIGSSKPYATITMSLLVGVFILHWLPYGIIIIVDVLHPGLFTSDVVQSLLWLLLLNSCWNPIIYAFSSIIIRHDLHRVLLCMCLRHRSHTSSPPSQRKSKMSVMFSGLVPATSASNTNFPSASGVNTSHAERSKQPVWL